MFIKKSPYLKPNIEKLQRQSENIDGTYSSEYSKEIMKAIEDLAGIDEKTIEKYNKLNCFLIGVFSSYLDIYIR